MELQVVLGKCQPVVLLYLPLNSSTFSKLLMTIRHCDTSGGEQTG